MDLLNKNKLNVGESVYTEKVHESEYVINHPLVIQWTDSFKDRAQLSHIFDNINAMINHHKSFFVAKNVGLWH